MSKTYRHILVTGGAGFVGSSIALRLKSLYPKARLTALDNLKRTGSSLNLDRLKDAGVLFVHGDIRNRVDLLSLPPTDLIIDCAADPSVLASLGAGANYTVDTNLVGTLRCLELVSRDKADFIFVSTSRVYPYDALSQIRLRPTASRFEVKLPLSAPGLSPKGVGEDYPLAGLRTLYGASKLSSEFLIAEYAHLHGFRYVINRSGVLSGPWQMGKSEQGIVSYWAAHHYFKKPLTYIGYGGRGLQVRDILHIDDFLELIEIQISHLARLSGSIFNVGGGKRVSVSLKELTGLCRSLSSHQVPVASENQTRPGDMPWYITDHARITGKTGWKPRRDAEQIVRDVLNWIDSHASLLKPVFLPQG